MISQQNSQEAAWQAWAWRGGLAIVVPCACLYLHHARDALQATHF